MLANTLLRRTLLMTPQEVEGSDEAVLIGSRPDKQCPIKFKHVPFNDRVRTNFSWGPSQFADTLASVCFRNRRQAVVDLFC
jgi:hypothetical protein